MATVRITSTLRRRVEMQISHGFKIREMQLKDSAFKRINWEPVKTLARKSYLHEAGWAEATIEAVPSGFLKVSPVVRIITVNNQPLYAHFRDTELAIAVPIPHDSFGTPAFHLEDPYLEDTAQVLKELNNDLSVLESEQRTVKQQVHKLLMQCTTLKQALGIWPQLEAFLPEDILNLHRAEVKREKTVIKVELDTDLLNVAAVKNKIAATVQ